MFARCSLTVVVGLSLVPLILGCEHKAKVTWAPGVPTKGACRLTSLVAPTDDGVVTVRATWEQGRLMTVAMTMDGHEVTEVYSYDQRGRLASINTSPGDQKTEFMYGADGNHHSIKGPGSALRRFEVDDKGRIRKEEVLFGGKTTLVNAYTYGEGLCPTQLEQYGGDATLLREYYLEYDDEQNPVVDFYGLSNTAEFMYGVAVAHCPHNVSGTTVVFNALPRKLTLGGVDVKEGDPFTSKRRYEYNDAGFPVKEIYGEAPDALKTMPLTYDCD